jgi:protein-tyrosine-phosphatase
VLPRAVDVAGHTLRRRGADPKRALFLCRQNHAGAILAQAIVNHLAGGRLRAVSAGSDPACPPHSYALECLTAHGITEPPLHTQPWRQFVGPNAPAVRFLITLCEPKSHRCSLPARVQADWGMPDPARVTGSAIDQRLAFEEAFVTVYARVRELLALPIERLSDRELSLELTRIGEMPA